LAKIRAASGYAGVELLAFEKREIEEGFVENCRQRSFGKSPLTPLFLKRGIASAKTSALIKAIFRKVPSQIKNHGDQKERELF
jgi:hypothetical protein